MTDRDVLLQVHGMLKLGQMASAMKLIRRHIEETECQSSTDVEPKTPV